MVFHITFYPGTFSLGMPEIGPGALLSSTHALALIDEHTKLFWTESHALVHLEYYRLLQPYTVSDLGI